MNNGGYIMVDMTGWTVGTETEMPGIYKRLSEALETKKPIFISGITEGGGDKPGPLNLIVYMDALNVIHIYYEGGGYAVSADDIISD